MSSMSRRINPSPIRNVEHGIGGRNIDCRLRWSQFVTTSDLRREKTAVPNGEAVVQVGRIQERILLVRGEKVIIDADLAEFYGVPTRALNQAVRRNKVRFPQDFMFLLTAEEKAEVVTNCDHLSKLKYSKSHPHAFTEHGALMAASVLDSQRAFEETLTARDSTRGSRRTDSDTDPGNQGND